MKIMNSTYQRASKYGALLFFNLLFSSNLLYAGTQSMHTHETASGSALAEKTTWADTESKHQTHPETHEDALSILFGNDYFAGNDSRYTSGFGLAWTSADINAFGPSHPYAKIGNLLAFIPTVKNSTYKKYLQFTLGMEIYTAEDITMPDPPKNDHPYAGILYLDNSIISIGPGSSHQFNLRLGVVGPASGAEYVQTRFHEIIDSPAPRGWDTQLRNEPIVNLFYQYGRRLVRNAPLDHFGFDLTANGGGGLGNYYTGANIGLTARIGCNLPDTYSSMPILGEAASLAGLSPAGNNFRCYAFLEPRFFGVLRWLPTDGNTFVDSRSGDRDRWFSNLSLGLVLGYGKFALSCIYHNIVGAFCFKNTVSGNQDSYGTVILTVFLG